MPGEQDSAYAAIRGAVARLTGECDFGGSQDAQGLNDADAWLGQVLAAMPAEKWTGDEALAAWDLLRKYPGELTRVGIDYGRLPRPVGADALAGERLAEARERVRRRARKWRRGQYRGRRSYVRCEGDGEQVTLAFPYDAALVEQAKAIEGRRFDRDTKANVFPFGRLPQVVAFADAHGIDVAPEVRAMVPAAAARAGQAGQEAARAGVRAGAGANTRWSATCAGCHAAPPGPGGILCPQCRAAIEARNAARARAGGSPAGAGDDGDDGAGPVAGRALRDAAHLYLDHGLLPVPAWAVRADGGCLCPRGADCPRPGKHPRSVHTGPGAHDYSWKPLVCSTHEEVEQRFADGGEYAAANLMVAISEGTLVIDQDNDDGGRQAIVTLAEQLAELPDTLGHRTPHGVHRIYRTPPGWTGRAWVGKDARNPLPAGIDLRVPGQILMAAPSRIPVKGGLVAYGPLTGSSIADLPAAYVTAWTPPAPRTAVARLPVAVPPGRGDAAAAYVHARISGIVEDLAAREPGGRNAAIYTAALKVGSTLGAARSTPGAEHAAAAWTDEAAETALMEAAERNGYSGKHGAGMARAAVRSGLRNGLRNPRPLPDFNALPAMGTARPRRSHAQRQSRRAGPAEDAGRAEHARPDVGGSVVAGPGPSARRTGRGRPTSVPDALARDVAAALHDAGFQPSDHTQDGTYGPEGYQIQAGPAGGIIIRHQAADPSVAGAAPSQRARRMLSEYASTLRRAGLSVTSGLPGTVTVSRQSAAAKHADGEAAGDRQNDLHSRANRVAAAASEAYRAGDLSLARQLVDRAAVLDPSRAALWQRHRTEIEAKRLFHEAQSARAEGHQGRAQKLVYEATQLDPRMRMLWDEDLAPLRKAHSLAPVNVSAGLARSATAARGSAEEATHTGASTGNRQRGLARPGARINPNPGGASGTRKPCPDGHGRVPPSGDPQAPSQQEARERPRAHMSSQAARSLDPADWRDILLQRARQEGPPQVISRQEEIAASKEGRDIEIAG